MKIFMPVSHVREQEYKDYTKNERAVVSELLITLRPTEAKF